MARARASSGAAPARPRRASSRAMRGVSWSAIAVVELCERLLHPRLGRRIAGIDPDHAGLVDLDRIDAQAVAAVVVGAGPQVELPVVPVAGEHAAVGVERAFDQGIAFVRAAVVAGVHGAVVEEQGELLGAELDRGPAAKRAGARARSPGSRPVRLRRRKKCSWDPARTGWHAQSLSYFLLLPRALSTGYFDSLTCSLARAAVTGSMPSASDN